MIAGLLAGAGLAAGLILIAVGLWPAQVPLARLLADYDAAARTHPTRSVPAARASMRWARLDGYLGRPLADALTGRARLSPTIRADLAVLGTDPATFLTGKTLTGVAGLLTPAAALIVLTFLGVSAPPLVPLWLCLAGAVVGFLLPDLRVRARAAAVRRDFRVALAAYLDLVAMRMASGAGLAEALADAARLCTGPTFTLLRGALADARTDGLSPAAALRRLGDELALTELVDTATRLGLVDASGAQAEASLRAQAASLRDRELSDVAGTANERTQSMLVAQVVLGFGFLCFLGYPAIAIVLKT